MGEAPHAEAAKLLRAAPRRARASEVSVMGLRVKRRCRCHGLTHGVPLLVAKTAVVTGFGGGGAAPSAACRRLAALMELDEQAEEQRRAAKLQAQRD